MAPPYIKVPTRDDVVKSGSLVTPTTAHMATTTLKVEGMT